MAAPEVVHKMSGKVESRLSFNEAILDNANFTKAKLYHPSTKREITMQQAFIQCLRPTEQLREDEQARQKDLRKHLAAIFGNSLRIASDKPKLSVIDTENEQFIENYLPES